MSAPDYPPDNRPFRTRLWSGYFMFLRGAMLAICILFVVVSLLVALLATLDILFGIGWGYQWFVIPTAIGMAFLGAIFFRLADRIIGAIARIAK